MRTMLVIPIDVTNDFLAHSRDMHGYQDMPHIFVFHGTYEALDHGDASMLAGGPEARCNVLPLAPLLEAWIPELRPFVADDVFWSRS